jgi:hypothetical protein
MFFLHHWFLTALLLSILYVGYVVFYAKLEVKNRPRETFYMCDKHGAYRASHALWIVKDVPYCPVCFAERLKSPSVF